jgi:hypothetical protein
MSRVGRYENGSLSLLGVMEGSSGRHGGLAYTAFPRKKDEHKGEWGCSLSNCSVEGEKSIYLPIFDAFPSQVAAFLSISESFEQLR